MARTSTTWRYALRWSMPHLPCPGAMELASCEVSAGDPCPPSVASLWRPGTGYAVCVDFMASAPPRRWSDERRGALRQRNMEKRIRRDAPLFADELISRELAARPAYFQGKKPS